MRRKQEEEPEQENEQEQQDKKEEAKEKEDNWSVGQVATQTQTVILSAEDPKNPLSIEQTLVQLLNNQDKILKYLG